MVTQANNTSKNHHVELNGIKMTIAEFARMMNISRNHAWYYIDKFEREVMKMDNSLIMRQSVIDFVRQHIFYDDYEGMDEESLISGLQDLPFAESEQKNGGWICYDPNGFKCLRCGRYLEIGCGDVKMNFCPHCGSYNGDEHNE